MRIALGIEQPVIGAAEQYAISLAQGLSERGHHVSLLVHKANAQVVARIIAGSRVSIGSTTEEISGALRAAFALLRSARPQCVHANQWASPLVMVGRALACPALVITDHVLPAVPSYNIRGSILRSITRAAANGLVVFSNQNREAAAHFGYRPYPTVIMPGIREPVCKTSRASIRRTLGLNENEFVVISVGRLSSEKRFDVLIRALDLVAMQGSHQVRGLIVGEGEGRSRLESMIRDANLGDRITMTGHVDDVGCLLKASDLYVHPSEREGFAFSVVEAMASGLPVVISDLPALREVVGDCAVPKFPVGGHVELARHIMGFDVDRACGKRLGESLRERWLAKFSVDRMVSDHEDFYASLLDDVTVT